MIRKCQHGSGFVYYYFCGKKQTVVYSTFKMADINQFWKKISKSFAKNYKLDGDCVNFKGFKDPDGYGVKPVTWPDGRVKQERAHRVAYMLKHRLIRDEVPRLDVNGLDMDVSHLCHNQLCITPSHLVLESHSTNMSQHYFL